MSKASIIVLITGANSGIGFAASSVIAKASDKYHVIMAARNEAKGKAALDGVKAMEGIKGEVTTLLLDQDDPESVKRAANEVEKQFGRIDVLVNNAAVATQVPDIQDQIRADMKTNVAGPAMVTQAFLPLLWKSKAPYSIYVSSGLGSAAMAEDPKYESYAVPYTSYRMSKSALNMWVLQEIKDLGPKGLKTFAMCPGYVVSNLRGTSEEARNGYGMATSPTVSGETMLSIIEGKRDADVGKFVHKDGIYPW